MATTLLTDLAAWCRDLAKDRRFCLAGCGLASVKTADHLHLSAGRGLETLAAEDFVAFSRNALRGTFEGDLPAVSPTENPQAPLHEMLAGAYVLAPESPAALGLVCARDGRQACRRLFPEAAWVPYADNGSALMRACVRALREHREAGGSPPTLLCLQNRGVLLGADSLDDLRDRGHKLLQTLEGAYADAGIDLELATAAEDVETIRAYAPQIRTLLGTEKARAVVRASAWFPPPAGPLTPRHVSHAGGFPVFAPIGETALKHYVDGSWRPPVMCEVPEKAVFVGAANLEAARHGMEVAREAALIEQYAQAFGGPHTLDGDARARLEDEEAARRPHAWTLRPGRLSGKLALVTGAAQGFGWGIARGMAGEGAGIVIADINEDGAREAADQLNAEHGPGCAIALKVDVSNEDSVAAMALDVARQCGGLDVLIANAGVLRAGSVKELSKRDWDFVTAIDYSGYFLCVKHLSQLMAAQRVQGQGAWTDIIQINSKSGLVGSNRNGAYAGAKFGGIGLTQSFALELVEDGIKVNSICPGNFFEGPLWSDPQKGLFVQYLNSGKVPGARSIDEVRRAYEKKVPMGRGCTPADVLKAIYYCIEQDYETGQAIPVTGGQVMVH